MRTSRQLLHHQLGAALATTTDFTTMIAMVTGLGLPPAIGTALGAAAGATVSFTLGRRYIFRAREGDPIHQAGRYALVSGGGLLLNSTAVWALTHALPVHYVVVRACVALTVGLVWSFPLQRKVVFGAHRS